MQPINANIIFLSIIILVDSILYLVEWIRVIIM